MAENILVTGGAGFIGSHLCRSLVRHGRTVTIIDDLSSGRRADVAQGATFIEGSILDRDLMRSLMRRADACVHLAAISSVARCNSELAASHTVNVTGFLTLLEAARDVRPNARVVYASSAAVYGGSQTLPLTESASASPLSSYGADKRACELYAAACHHSFGLTSIGLRFFNIYGPGQSISSPYSGVVSQFLRRSMAKQPLILNGDGRQTRDFVYVSDAVDGLLAAIDAQSEAHGVFNVCTGIETSISKVADTLNLATGNTNGCRMGPAREGDIYRSRGDPAKLADILGVLPKVSFEEGISRLIACSFESPLPAAT